jgi:multiple antibiotic resistance protein
MNYSAAGGWGEITVTVLAFAALCIITFICFVFSSKIIAAIGENGLSIVTRLMGLILSVIGVQMLIDGITAVVSSIG